MEDFPRARLKEVLTRYMMPLPEQDPGRMRALVAHHLKRVLELDHEEGFLLVDRALRSEGTEPVLLVRTHHKDRRRELWPLYLRSEITPLLGGEHHRFPRFTNAPERVNDLELREAVKMAFETVGDRPRSYDHVVQAFAEHFAIVPDRRARCLVDRAVRMNLIRIQGREVARAS